MRTGIFLFIIMIIAACSGCQSGGAGWRSERVTEIVIRDADFEVVRTIQDPARIEQLLANLKRSERVGDTRTRHQWTHNIDISGSSRLLYESSSGDFAVLSAAVMPVYRVKEDERAQVEALFTRAGGF